MAASAFSALCRERGLSDVEVDSAGLSGSDTGAVSPEVRALLAEREIPLLRLGSKRLTARTVLWADLIVVMTERHREILCTRFLPAREKTVKLLDLVSGGSVPDPYGGTQEEYAACLASMMPALEVLAERMAR